MFLPSETLVPSRLPVFLGFVSNFNCFMAATASLNVMIGGGFISGLLDFLFIFYIVSMMALRNLINVVRSSDPIVALTASTMDYAEIEWMLMLLLKSPLFFMASPDVS